MKGIAATVFCYDVPLWLFCATDFDLDHEEKFPKKSVSTSVSHLGL